MPGQIEQQKRTGTINALNTLRLQQEQRQVGGQQAMAGMMRGDQLPAGDVGPRQDSYLGPDGLFDVAKITHALGKAGYGDQVADLVKGAEGINASILKHQESAQKTAQAHAILIGDLAHGAIEFNRLTGAPILDSMDAAVQPALASKSFTPSEYAQLRQQIGQMPPEQQKAALNAFREHAAKLGGEYTLSEGAIRMDRYDRKIGTGGDKPPTETELALRAAKGDQDAIAAMNRLKPAPNRTSEMDDQRYRDIVAKGRLHQPISPEDVAWAQGYEKQKTLGVDTSASAAANRQAAAIAAQTAQQSRAQTFAEAQAGRKELTDKVETPYLTAVGSANTLRDVVAAAKAGNKVAASLQSLETTMSAIRAQGLNRINTAEIGVTANAGNLWDRIVGHVGKLAAGEPVPADLQQDMLQFADILEKAAHKKYEAGFDATTKRYGLTAEQKLPPPGGGTIRMRAPNGQEQDVSPDQVDHYKSRGAIVVKR
jgi:hypothetical protein